jgi:hypothetical protein
MNESLKKIIIFISITAIIGFLIFFPWEGGHDPGDNPKINNSNHVEKFRLRCDSLRNKVWNQADYKILFGSLLAMKSNQIFTSSDAYNLEIYLNQAYANTLKDSCASWLTTSGNNADRKLLDQMEMISINPGCSKILTYEIKLMRAYFSALQIPNRVRSFTQTKFSIEQYTSLLNLIKNTSQLHGISHFASMKKLASDGINQLSEFREFATNYDLLYNFYIRDKNNPDALDNLRNFCPQRNPITSRFSYYLQEIKTQKGICN